MTNEELNNALYEKMRDEFVEYKEDLCLRKIKQKY